MSGTESGNQGVPAEDEADTVEANFDPATWEPVENRYGLVRLLGLRDAMLPIQKPDSIKSLKFLFFPGHGVDTGEAEERERRSERRDGGDKKRQEQSRDLGKGKGKSRAKEKQPVGGRFVPEMGKTELEQNYVRNQWFRNVSGQPVVIREGFSLMSTEIWKVPAGHYVQQSGPAEVFVSGQATGLIRMPVGPNGWATADASAVGGPKYLEAVRSARWEVAFKSDQTKGDILVRQSVSLESDEVGCIHYGTYVLQNGPQITLEDGIIRMPISWVEAEPSSGSGKVAKSGWVTCDASSQGGPKFFKDAPDLEDGPPNAAAQVAGRAPAAASPDRRAPATAADGFATWDKNRIWKVTNLDDDRSLPLVTRSEPYAPGGRSPPEEIVVRWLVSGDVVEQIGHSKKTKGCMVMPVKVVSDEKGDVQDVEGWVTRRMVDKQRESAENSAWFEELRDGDANNERERRRDLRRKQREADR